LGRLPALEQAYSLMAGFGMQLWGIVQDLSQLARVYGEHGWQTFISNSGVIQYFGSRDKMTALLSDIRDGNSVDRSLTQVYNFDVNGLEDAWRQSINAKPRTESARPSALATPTIIPTIVPVSGAHLIITPTTVNVPPPTPTTLRNGFNPPSIQQVAIVLVSICCALLAVLGIVIAGIVIIRRKRAGGQNEKVS